MPEPMNHDAILELYQTYRTVLMNVKYYGRRLADAQRRNTIMEVLVAAGTSSTFGSLAIWSTSYGKPVLATCALVATLLSISKPFLGLPKAVERYSKLWSGFSVLAHELEASVQHLRVHHEADQDVVQLLRDTSERMRGVCCDEDPRPNDEVREWAYQQVNQEVPPESLWNPIPSAAGTGAAASTPVDHDAAPVRP